MKTKNKIKKYLKLGIFFLGILFTLSNCITDDFQINENENIEYDKLNVKTISISDFNSKKGIQKKLKLLSSKYDINKKPNKNINSNDGAFTILTDEILEVSTDSITTTYTFRIETPTDSISTFENFMVEQKNDTLKFFIYKFIYDETYPDFFPYETTIQNVDDNQINSENFNEYLKDGYVTGGDGCLYYHTDAYYVESNDQAEYYGNGYWVPASDELIFCPKGIDAGPSTSSGGYSSTAGDDYADGDYGNGTDNGDSTDNGNTYGGNTGDTNNGQNTSNSNVGNINKPASYVVLPPKASNLINSLENLLNINFNNSQELWISQNLVKAKQVLDYLNANPNSQEAQNLALDVIQAAIDGVTISFETIEDYECQSKVILNAIINNSTFSSNLTNIFTNIDNGYNLNFEVNETLHYPSAGATDWTSSQAEFDFDMLEINIDLSIDLMNASDLGIAMTVIHESFHAMILYLVETNQINTVPPNSNLSSYAEAYADALAMNQINNGLADIQQLNDLQHEYMAQIVSQLSSAITAYGESQNYELDPLYYEALAWMGLADTFEFLEIVNEADDGDEDATALVDMTHTVQDNELHNLNNNANGTICD